MVFSSIEWMLIRRYLWPGRGGTFIAIVAAFSLVAVMLGVATLIAVSSIMNGFRAELFDKFVGLNGHAIVQGYNGRLNDWQSIAAQARAIPGVTSALPLIEQPLMASAGGRIEGVEVRGMRSDDIQNNRNLAANLRGGDLRLLAPGSNNVAIGAELADALGAQVGTQISLLSPQGETTPFGTVPRIVSYRVAAIFRIGVYDFDKAFVIMPMQDAQTLLLMGDSVGMVEVNTNDPEHVDRILAPLTEKVAGRAVISDWRQTNAGLFKAMQVDRVVISIVVSLIILVAMFNIVSSLIMLVRAKTRDIAVLRTMGADRRAIQRVFVAVGMTIGLLGTGLGLILAALFLTFRQQIVDAAQWVSGVNIWDPTIRQVTELPARTDPLDVLLILGMTIGGSLLATLLPAYQAANTDPVKVLRYE